MATTAVRSPSPSPAARSGCGAVRRSADSIPGFRPASPSDSLLRSSSSVCRNASPRAWGAEKENSEQRDAAGRMPKPARSAGGAKNFMAPTISAASKAVAPSASPRKKVLGERNERAGDVELAYKPTGGAPPSSEAGTPRRLRLSFDGAPVVPPAAKPVASHVSRHSFGGEERRVENPVCKEHHHAAAVDAAASSEAEPYPAAAPYDPKTNYLSPRPQFLHYKPNPRIELYRHGGRRLEDGFASESSSEETDTTTTSEEEEEVVVEPAEDEQEQQTHPSSEIGDDAAVPEADACALPLEPPSGSPLARVLTPESARSSPRARVHTSEPTETSPRARVLTPEPEPNSARARAKKRSSLRFLVPPIALVLFMAAIFICVAPPPDSPVMPQTALSKVSNFLSVQELYPVEMAVWLKQWPSSSLNLVTSYWEALVSTQEQEIFGPHFAANLSAAAANADEGSLFGNFAEFEDVCVSVEPDLKIQEAVSIGSDLIAEIGDVAIARDQESIHNADVEQEAVPERASVIEVANENDSGFLSDELNVGTPKENSEMSEGVPGSNGEEMASFSQNLEPSQPTVEPEQLENIESSVLPLEQDVQTDDSEGDRADGEENPEAHHGMQQSELAMWPGYLLDKVSKPAAVGIALAAVIVPAVLALLHLRQRQIRVGPNADAPAEQDEQIVETQSGSGSSEYHTHGKGSQLQTPVADEAKTFGGSGASHYSSGLSSGHAKRRNVKEDDSLSLGTVSRRESTAYSTSSYGSFTTYEKIPAKKKNKDDEAMTPVRRSSRLRNQNKSPEA
ncbi:hypothetical protein ABZP36_019573 [Zizania latifolia]